MSTATADHSVIRKAGKATAVLQFFAIGLVVVLGFIYYDISNRYTEMQSGIRENAMWSVYQLDREARNLQNRLAVMLASDDLSMTSQKDLATHYDILYSRMDMLAEAKFERNFRVDADVAKQLSAIQQSVFANTAIFDDIEAGNPASRGSLMIAQYSFDTVIANTEKLVTYTNNTLSSDRALQREAVGKLETKSLVLIGVLGMIVGALILMLRRQLSSVRAAGLSFERMANSLESAFQAAEAGNRAKSQFMATMSHEIRTPLNAILGTVEFMEFTPTDPETGRNLRTIRKSGEALLDIINEILDFSKIERGKLELETRTVDIGACAEAAIEMMRGRAMDSGNEVVLDLPDDLPAPFVRTDATRLRQVILNLMSNAIKFTRNGTVTLSMAERMSEGSLMLRVEVRDTGIGIDDAGRAKLFLPFSQVDASIARKYGGTGLGLTICKEIVELLGGTIGVDSVYGSGSTFWFEIPVERASAPRKANETKIAEATPLPRLKFLVVEDNAVNLHVATKFLVHLGQEVHAAENGAVAVDKAAAQGFDVILMDMQMPVMDGIEAAERIRSGGGRSCRSPIIAMTANASDDDRRKCLEAGMDDFQSKPISTAQLRAIILAAAHEKAQSQAIAPTAGRNEGLEMLEGSGDALDMTALDARRIELVEVLGEEDFRELLDAFFDDAKAALDALGEGLRSGQVFDAGRLLHTIRGAAGNVGLQPIADTAQDMRARVFGPDELARLRGTVERYRAALAA